MSSATQGRPAAPVDRRWLVLVVVAIAQLMVVLDSSIVSFAVNAAGIEVKRQHPAGTRGGVIHRHRARLLRRLSGQRARPPRRVGAAAVL